MSDKSDTPRTNANRYDVDTYAGEYISAPSQQGEWVKADFTLQLERELNRWKALAILLGEYVEPEQWQGVQAYDALDELEHLKETNQPNQ